MPQNKFTSVSASDQKASITEIWDDFRVGLTHALTDLADGESFSIDIPPRSAESEVKPYFQFAGYDNGWIRAEVSSNSYLSPAEWLNDQQLRLLHEARWLPPSDPDDDDAAAGSTNHFFDAAPGDVASVVNKVLATARIAFNVSHPAFLLVGDTPKSASDDDEEVFEGLEAVEDDPMSRGRVAVRRLQVGDALTDVFDLEFVRETDDDFSAYYGDVIVYVSVSEDIPAVSSWSLLLVDVPTTEDVLRRINEENDRILFGKLVLDKGVVTFSFGLWCEPFVRDLVAQGVRSTCETIDRLIGRLHAAIGGTLYAETQE